MSVVSLLCNPHMGPLKKGAFFLIDCFVHLWFFSLQRYRKKCFLTHENWIPPLPFPHTAKMFQFKVYVQITGRWAHPVWFFDLWGTGIRLTCGTLVGLEWIGTVEFLNGFENTNLWEMWVKISKMNKKINDLLSCTTLSSYLSYLKLVKILTYNVKKKKKISKSHAPGCALFVRVGEKTIVGCIDYDP